MAQWLECWPEHRRVLGLMNSSKDNIFYGICSERGVFSEGMISS